MSVSRVFLVASLTVALALSAAPHIGVSAEVASNSQRRLMNEVVKVHVKVHRDAQHEEEKDKKEKSSTDSRETVRSYDRGTVRIDSIGSKATKKSGNSRLETHAAEQTQDNETEVNNEHGTVEIAGEKDGRTTRTETGNSNGKLKKGAAAKALQVGGSARKATKIATKLSSAASADKTSFHDTYGPIVVICGIIGGLAAIVGVAGLVMDQPHAKKGNYLDESAETDVEAGVVPVGAHDDDVDSDLSSDSGSDDDGEEGVFSNSAVQSV
ncbi:unnamed protein product [Hyaloperonospora brassicae]|uniref:RxLR effector candidate protein n=1 Tax=Hyaloperonospora brassicae TaxID=162125 RepID=A0AAV0U5F7_HYABA|nr:unnamed protein product [Hyaloperonospora brassicae]